MKGPNTQGDVIARLLASNSDHHVLRRVIAQINDPKQQNLLLAGLFEQMDPIEKMGFLAHSEIPEAWRQKHADELAKDVDDAGTGLLRGQRQAQES